MSQRIPSIYVAPSPKHGKGVFTSEEIAKDNLLEICPIILIPAKDMALIEKTVIYNYFFTWGEDDKSGAIALGFGSIYNHSINPNAYYLVDYDEGTVLIYSKTDIMAGEEICFNYNGDADDKSDVWFDVK